MSLTETPSYLVVIMGMVGGAEAAFAEVPPPLCHVHFEEAIMFIYPRVKVPTIHGICVVGVQVPESVSFAFTSRGQR